MKNIKGVVGSGNVVMDLLIKNPYYLDCWPHFVFPIKILNNIESSVFLMFYKGACLKK